MKKVIFLLLGILAANFSIAENPIEGRVIFVTRQGGGDQKGFLIVESWSDGAQTHVRCSGSGNLKCAAIVKNGDNSLDLLFEIAQEKMLDNGLKVGKITNGLETVAWQSLDNFEHYKLWEVVD